MQHTNHTKVSRIAPGKLLSRYNRRRRRITYLLRDLFTTNRAAGAVNGTSPEPGPGGARFVTDTESKLSLSASKAVFAGGKATPAIGDPAIWWGSTARTSGRALFMQMNFSSAAFTMFGFDNNQATTLGGGAIQTYNDGQFTYMETSTLETGKFASYAPLTDYMFAFVLRTTGSFVLVRGGEYPDWQLVWVGGTTNVSTPLNPCVASKDCPASAKNIHMSDLGSPWNSDYGVATQRLAGARAGGDNFTHEGDCHIHLTATTLPSAGNMTVNFRVQDANNYWQLVIASTGALTLNEVVAGTPTSRGTGAAGSVAAGQRVVIRASGQEIRVFANNALKIQYNVAANFKTATSGTLSSLGTGGAVSDIVTYPIHISGQALSVLGAAAGPFFTEALVDNWVDPAPQVQRFVWLTDIHVTLQYNTDSWTNVCKHVATIRPTFVLNTGDTADRAWGTEFDYYFAGIRAAQLTAPIYTVPGNHDSIMTNAGGGAMTNQWQVYDAAGLTRHFTVDIGPFRIIAFSTYEDDDGVIATTAYIDSAEKTWVLARLAECAGAGKTPILATHYNAQMLIDGGTWPTFQADITTYNIKGYLSGHDHFSCPVVTYSTICQNVRGASVWGQATGQTPGMMVWYVYSDRMEMTFSSARYPYSDFGPGTTPAYNKITIYA